MREIFSFYSNTDYHAEKLQKLCDFVLAEIEKRSLISDDSKGSLNEVNMSSNNTNIPFSSLSTKLDDRVIFYF